MALASLGIDTSDQLRAVHGPRADDELQLWMAIETLGIALSPSNRDEELAWELVGILHECWTAAGLALDPDGPLSEPVAFFEAAPREDPLRHVRAWAARHLGIEDSLRHGQVPELGLSYPRAYGLARRLGELQALHLLGQTDDLAEELPIALKLLGRPALDEAWTVGAYAELAPVWEQIDPWLEAVVQGESVWVYRAGHDLTVLREVGFAGLTLRAAMLRLVETLRALNAHDLARRLALVADDIQDVDLSEPDGVQRPTHGLIDAIGAWLSETVPTEAAVEIFDARVAVWEHRFRGFHAPVTAARIEAFLYQFPSAERWVGEGLLDAVQFLGEDQLSGGLRAVIENFGLLANRSIARANLGRDHGERLLSGHPIQHRDLEAALGARELDGVLLADDACITGTRAIAALSDRLGLTDDPRDPALLQGRLHRRQLNFVFALGSVAGVQRVRDFCAEQNLHNVRFLVGRELRLLSLHGIEAWGDGDLLDEHGIVTVPGSQLAEPLFSPHHPTWRGHDVVRARELCAEIGLAVLEATATERGWTPERRAGSALGYSGLQTMLVFGHRVPRTTLPLLWASGTWKGQPWIPLFA